MRQGAAVDVFQFAAQRHAVREPAGQHAGLARQLRQVVRGRLAFDGRIGGDDQLLHLARRQARGQPVQPELARADAVQRREPALQHEIEAAVTGGGFDRQPVGG